VTEAMV